MKKTVTLALFLSLFLIGFSQKTLDYYTINTINRNNELLRLEQAEALDSTVTKIDFLGSQFIGQRGIFEYTFCGEIEHARNYKNNLLSDLIDVNMLTRNRALSIDSDVFYIYGNQCVLQEQIKSEIDSISEELTYNEKNIFNYDDNQHVDYTMNYEWNKDSGEWVFHGKTEMTYNDNYQLIKKEDYTFENEQYNLEYVTTYTINENDDITLTLEQEWSEASQSLMNKKKTEVVYVSQHIVEYSIDYEYTDAMEWNPTRKIDFEYDDIDMSQIFVSKSEDGQTWNNNFKVVLFYDYDTPLEDIILPLDMGEIYQYVHHKIVKMDLYKYFLFQYQDMGVTDFYYNMMEIDTEDLLPNYTIYPNPANEVLHINMENKSFEGTLEILNMAGQIILKQPVNEKTTISVRGLEKGMYLYHLYNGKAVYNGKFVKE